MYCHFRTLNNGSSTQKQQFVCINNILYYCLLITGIQCSRYILTYTNLFIHNCCKLVICATNICIDMWGLVSTWSLSSLDFTNWIIQVFLWVDLLHPKCPQNDHLSSEEEMKKIRTVTVEPQLQACQFWWKMKWLHTFM